MACTSFDAGPRDGDPRDLPIEERAPGGSAHGFKDEKPRRYDPTQARHCSAAGLPFSSVRRIFWSLSRRRLGIPCDQIVVLALGYVPHVAKRSSNPIEEVIARTLPDHFIDPACRDRRTSIALYWTLGDAVVPILKRVSQQTLADEIGISQAKISRAAGIRKRFATAEEATRAWDAFEPQLFTPFVEWCRQRE